MPLDGEGFIALNHHPTPNGVIRLSSPINGEDFAHRLYSAMRKADGLGINTICIIVPPGLPLTEALMDRVSKAAQ
jgi:L-threonylcarbamoyladenylate synthase